MAGALRKVRLNRRELCGEILKNKFPSNINCLVFINSFRYSLEHTSCLFIFDLALKNFFIAQAHHALTQKIRRKKIEIMTKTKKFQILYDSPKATYPWRLLWYKNHDNPKSHTWSPLIQFHR